MNDILQRFLRYVAVDTRSDEKSATYPSFEGEWTLLRMLRSELLEMGIDARLDSRGYVTARIKSNIPAKVPAVGFISHVDTSPEVSGKDVRPQVIESYDGSPIALKGVPGLFLDPDEFPELLLHKGETLITSDGTTLLGADDKAGVAEIMSAARYLSEHPEFPHGDVCIAFTPDEEIGRGVEFFDIAAFGADYAYTMDGGDVGEVEYENFNAASAKVTVRGRSVHPGSAKGIMKNSISIAREFDSMLPSQERPEYTEGYEGFFHLMGISGSVEQSSLTYIIRDHDRASFESRKSLMLSVAGTLNSRYGQGTVEVALEDSYYNMREKIESDMRVVEVALKAMELAGVKPRVQPIRGGTDGAMLSLRGLPCPNLFAGGLNFHSCMEWCSLNSMQLAREVIVKIISLFADEAYWRP